MVYYHSFTPERELVMDNATREMVKGWLAKHNGDVEGLARWMRDSLRIGGLKECRALVTAAVEG